MFVNINGLAGRRNQRRVLNAKDMIGRGKMLTEEKKKEHAFKNKARKITNSLIRAGKIKRKPCVVCGDKKSETHHIDYNKPDKVKFLCKKCHAEEHVKLRGGRKPRYQVSIALNEEYFFRLIKLQEKGVKITEIFKAGIISKEKGK